MPRDKAQTKSRRRETHRTFAGALRERKRLRRQRAEIHAALEQAKRPKIIVHVGPFRAPDVKTEQGWVIFDSDDRVCAYVSSRERARKEAHAMTEDGTTSVYTEAPDVDGTMTKLGFKRIGPDRDEQDKANPIEQRWRKVAS